MNSKEVGTDGPFLCTMNIKAVRTTCIGCGKIHFMRVTILDNWQNKFDNIDEETFWKIVREQELAIQN